MLKEDVFALAQICWPSDRRMWSADGELPRLERFASMAETNLRDYTVAALRAEVRRLQSELERLPARRAHPTAKTAPIAPPNLAFFGIAETDEEFAERAGRAIESKGVI